MHYILQNAYSDLDALLALINDAYRSNAGKRRWTTEAHLVSGDRMTRENLTRMLAAENVRVIGAYSEESLVGCLAASQRGEIVEFSAFAIQPALHGTGLGKQLLAHAEATVSNACRIYQVSVVSLNKDLINFYIRRGYQLTGEHLQYPRAQNVGTPIVADIDLVVMQKFRS